MVVKRTFSLDPEVDAFLSTQSNRSRMVNTILRQYLKDLEQNELIEGYHRMNHRAILSDLSVWESAALLDGLAEG